MFRIKICGVKTSDDVDQIARSGADAVGLNFFPKSIRYLRPESSDAQQISNIAGELSITRVGVVVNQTLQELESLISTVALDAIQLHGDEPAETATQWTKLGLPVIRAIKLPTGELAPNTIEEKCEAWLDAGCHPLFDADAGTAHGGSGKTLHWQSIRSWSEKNPGQPFTLAGGLHSGNLLAALEQSGAKSVDTASGAEEPRGQKNENKIKQFVDAFNRQLTP